MGEICEAMRTFGEYGIDFDACGTLMYMSALSQKNNQLYATAREGRIEKKVERNAGIEWFENDPIMVKSR